MKINGRGLNRLGRARNANWPVKFVAEKFSPRRTGNVQLCSEPTSRIEISKLASSFLNRVLMMLCVCGEHQYQVFRFGTGANVKL